MDNIPAQAADLKPMSLSELLDRTFTLYRNRFGLFFGLRALPEIAILLCSLVVIVAFPVGAIPMGTVGPQNPFAALAAIQPRLAAGLIVLFFQVFFSAYALGAVTVAVSEIYLGRAATIRGSYAVVRSRIFGLFGLILMLILVGFVFLFGGSFAGGIIGAIAMVGFSLISPPLGFIVLLLMLLAGVIAAFWLMMRFAVSIPVFMLERLGIVDSMSRSGTLTHGNRNRIFGTVIVMYVVLLVFQVAFTLPFIIVNWASRLTGVFPMWIQIGQTVAAAVASTIAGPLLMIAIALIYYDVRIRKEAFDLEAMMNALGPSGGTSGSAAVPPPMQPAS